MNAPRLLIALSLAALLSSCGNESAGTSSETSETFSSSDVNASSSLSETETIPEIDGYHLLWSDEFDGESLDYANWTYDVGNGNWGWGNGEKQYYTTLSRNSYVEDGALHIVAMADPTYANCDYTSARLKSVGLFNFTYGRIEARLSLPTEVGMWPAFWLLPDEEGLKDYGGWPSSGEIDIMERMVSQETIDETGNDLQVTSSALHYGTDFGGNSYSIYQTNEHRVADNVRNFHVYGCEWTKDYIRTYVDDEEVIRVERATWARLPGLENTSAPFDKPFYILLNLAVGGRVAHPEEDFVSDEMIVDYIRVYQENQLS